MTSIAALLAFARLVMGLLLLGMVAVNVVNAAGRYVFGWVIIGADELLVMSMIWLVAIGMLVAAADRSHLALSALPDGISGRARTVLFVLHDAVLTAGCCYAALQSWAFTQRIASIGQTSMALGIPTAIQHGALVLGFALTALVGLVLLIRDISTLIAGDTAP
jgi:TRAP-type C4-dicarboxylate transport system permease small subunit